MDRLDSAQARDHMDMLERILAESSQRLCYGGEYFVVWGLYSGLATLSWHFVSSGILPAWTLWIQAVLLVGAIVFSVVRGRMKRAERRSIVQREFFNVLWLTLGLAFVANLGAYRIFNGAAAPAIWSFAAAVVLFFIGLHGNRRAQIAGILVIVSLIVANFTAPANTAYVLAAGMVVGYAGFGLSEMLARD